MKIKRLQLRVVSWLHSMFTPAMVCCALVDVTCAVRSLVPNPPVWHSHGWVAALATSIAVTLSVGGYVVVPRKISDWRFYRRFRCLPKPPFREIDEMIVGLRRRLEGTHPAHPSYETTLKLLQACHASRALPQLRGQGEEIQEAIDYLEANDELDRSLPA